MQKSNNLATRALVLCVILNLLAGFQYCWSMLGRSLINQYGWTASQAALPYTVLTIVTSCWSIMAGRLGERVAPRGTIVFGGLCMGFGLIISGHTSSPIVMLISVGVLLGLASTSITTNTSPTAMKWFPASRRGFITGCCTMGMGLSSLYMAPIINALLANVGLSNTFTYMGIAAIILICGCALMLPISPAHMDIVNKAKAERGGAKPATKTPEELAAEEAAARKMDEEDSGTLYQNKVSGTAVLKTKEFWFICLIYCCAWMPGQMITSAVANICTVQANWENAALAVMAMAIGNGAGRLVSSTLSDKLGPVKTYRYLLALQVVNMLLFRFYTIPAVLFVGVVLLGFIVGSAVPLKITVVAEVYGRRNCAQIAGMVDPAFGVAGFGGPMVAAALLDMTGSYNMSYLFNAAVLALGVFATFMIKTNGSKKSA